MTDVCRREKEMTLSKLRTAYFGLWHLSLRLMMLDILDAMPTPGYVVSHRVTPQVQNVDQYHQCRSRRHNRVYPGRVLEFHQSLLPAHLELVHRRWMG